MSTKKYTSDAYIIQKLQQRIDYMEFVIKGVQIFGSKKFYDSLHELGILTKLKKTNSLDKNDFSFFSEADEAKVDFILSLVVNEWEDLDVKKEDLFTKGLRLEHSRAREMAVILIKKHTTISDQKIGEYFNRSRQYVHLTYRKYRKMLTQRKQNKTFFIRYNSLNKQIVNHFKN